MRPVILDNNNNQDFQPLEIDSRLLDQTSERRSGVPDEFKRAAAEDAARQRGDAQAPNPNDVFTSIINSTTTDEIQQLGYTNIGNFPINPSSLEFLRKTPTKQNELRQQFLKEYTVPKQEPGQLAVGFSSPDYTEMRLPPQFRDDEDIQQYVKNEQAVAKVLSESGLPLRGQRIILKDYANSYFGNSYAEITQEFMNIPTTFTQDIPTLASMAGSAIYSAPMALYQKGDYNETYFEALERNFGGMMAAAHRNGLGFAEQITEDNELLGSARQRMEGWYKRKYIEQHGRDAFIRDHMFSQKTEIVTGEDGQMSLQLVTDGESNPVYDETLDPQIMQTLLKASEDELNSFEKAAKFFVGGGPLVVLNVARKAGRGKQFVDEFEKMRTDPSHSRYKKDYEGLTDVELYRKLYREDVNAASKAWRRTWDALTLNGWKSDLEAGRVLSDHAKAIRNYDETIKDLDAKIYDLRNKGKLDATEEADLKNLTSRLEFTTQSRQKYIDGSGGTGRIFNPYSKQTLYDEALISGAVGLASTYNPIADLTGMNDQVAEVLTMLVAPLVAPAAGRVTTNLALGVARRTPLLNIGVGAIEELGISLQNSGWLSKVGVEAVIRGDVAELRSIAEMEGLDLTDADILSFRAFSRALNKMGNEKFKGPDGRMITVRDRVYDSLVAYGDNMNRMQLRMEKAVDANGNRIFSDEQVQENMKAIHLSLAYASGFAPFIQIQQLASKGESISKIFEGKGAETLFRSIRTQEEVLNGMSTQLKVLRQTLSAEGVNLSSNDPLDEVFRKLTSAYDNGVDDLVKRKQQLNQLIDIYLKDPASVDENTVNEIVDLKLMLNPELATDTASRARLAEEVAGTILTNFNQRQSDLMKLAGKLSPTEFNKEVALQADSLFDTVVGLRQAKGSARYAKVKAYGEENNILVPMEKLFDKLRSLDPSIPTGINKKFMIAGGREVQESLNSMAERGLREQFGNDTDKIVEKMIADSGGELKENSKTRYADVAFYMMDREKVPEGEAASKFFNANVEEAEHIRRHLAYQARIKQTSKDNIVRTATQISKEFRDSVDELYTEADPSGELLKLVEDARIGYKIDVGDPMDDAAYGGKVRRARSRQVTQIADDQRKYVYGNRNTPEGIFLEIGGTISEIATTVDIKRSQDLQEKLVSLKQDLMSFYGVSRDKAGTYILDMTDPDEAMIADGVTKLLQMITNKKVGYALSADLGPLAKETEISKLPKELQPKVRSASQKLKKAQKNLPEFNFERAERLRKAEEELAITVRKADGKLETRRPFSTELREQLAPIDDMLEENQQYRDVAEDLIEEVNSTTSQLRVAGDRTLEKVNVSLDRIKDYTSLAKRPRQFFETYFETATPQSVERLKKDLTTNGEMTAEEANLALKELYIRGLLEKTGLQNKAAGTGFGRDTVQDISDIDVLVNHMRDEASRPAMVAVLGEEHVKHLEDIADWMDNASGNGAGVRTYLDVGDMRMESKIARVFNLARGMVGLDYVTAEVGFRLMMQKQQSMIQFVMNNKNAALVLSKALQFPQRMTRADMRILALEIRSHITLELLKANERMDSLDTIVNGVGTLGVKQLVKEKEEQEKARVLNETLQEEEEQDDEEEQQDS